MLPSSPLLHSPLSPHSVWLHEDGSLTTHPLLIWMHRARHLGSQKSDQRITQLFQERVLCEECPPTVKEKAAQWVLFCVKAKKKHPGLSRLERWVAPEKEATLCPFSLPTNVRMWKRWKEAHFPLEALLHNRDLIELFRQTHWDTHISFFRHSIPLDDEGAPLLLFRGEWTPWAEVKQQIHSPNQSTLENWCYLQEGVVPWKTFHWEKLRPFHQLPEEERPEKHTIRLLTGAKKDLPDIIQDYGHTWIQMIRPNGELYSIGFYAPESFIANPQSPLKTLPGVFHSPDLYEFLPGRNKEAVQYTTSEQRFEQLLQMVESWQKIGLPYNTLEQNCSDVAQTLYFAGKEEKNTLSSTEEMSVWWLTELPLWTQHILKGVWGTLPLPIRLPLKWGGRIATTLSLSPLLYSLGAHRGLFLSSQSPNVAPLLPSPLSLFHKRLHLLHPKGVRRWQRQQPSWRSLPS